MKEERFFIGKKRISKSWPFIIFKHRQSINQILHEKLRKNSQRIKTSKVGETH